MVEMHSELVSREHELPVLLYMVYLSGKYGKEIIMEQLQTAFWTNFAKKPNTINWVFTKRVMVVKKLDETYELLEQQIRNMNA